MRRPPYTVETRPVDSVLVCSDLHCPHGRRCPQLAAAAETARRLSAQCLALAGDLFDDLHEPIDAERLAAEVEAILGGEETPGLIVYTTSLSSHDPLLPRPVETRIGGSTLVAVPGLAVIPVAGKRLCVLHGDLAVANGAVAHLVNRAAALLGRPLYLEHRLREWLCPNGLLVAGHTHIPGVSGPVANPGSWRSLWLLGLPYWRRPSRTCVYVDRGGMRLVEAQV